MGHVPAAEDAAVAAVANDGQPSSSHRTSESESGDHALGPNEAAVQEPALLIPRLESMALPNVSDLSHTSTASQTTANTSSQRSGDDTTSESSLSRKSPRSPSTSTTSLLSSSEAKDILGPLPSSRPRIMELKNAQMTVGLSNSFPSSQAPTATRLSLPSPPALGLSELLSGTPVTPGNEVSYFDLCRDSSSPRSTSTSRRPHYSPFRSYYGDTGPSQARRYLDPKTPTLGSPTCSADRPSLTSSQGQYETGLSTSHSTTYNRGSPRIKNSDGILAPHGTFTSSRRRLSMSESQNSSAHSSDSVRLGTTRRKAEVDSMEPVERHALEAAAVKGDQLAMYRLGWRGDNANGQRYHIGTIEDVWGTTTTTVDQGSTIGTARTSVSTIGSDGSTNRRKNLDLSHDAANLVINPDNPPTSPPTDSQELS